MTSANGEKEPKAVDLAKISAEEKADRRRETKVLSEQASTKRKKKVILISSVSAVALALVATLVIYDPFTSSLRFGNGDAPTTAAPPVETTKFTPNQATSGNWNGEAPSEQDYPIALDDWQTNTYDPEQDAGGQASALGKYQYGSLWSQAGVLPPESAGFTSDLDKKIDSDGMISAMYSFWTQERFTGETGLILERLVNPIVGGWTGAQFSSALFNPNSINDIFTTEWVESQGATSSNYPVYVDWSDQNYGVSFGSNALRWVGTVDTVDTIWNYNTELQQYTVDLTAGVTYTAYGSDGQKIVRNGQLILTLVANPDQSFNNTDHRVLISQATLKVGP